MKTSNYNSAGSFSSTSTAESVKDSLRSYNPDISYMTDDESPNDADPRFSVLGYETPTFDNDRELSDFLYELSIQEAENEYISYMEALSALEPVKSPSCSESQQRELSPRRRNCDARFFMEPLNNDNWLVIDSFDFSMEAFALTEKDAINLTYALNSRLSIR